MSTEQQSCYNCGDIIEGTKLVAIGKTWHPEHFVCAECNCVIAGDSCCEIDGLPYCDQDFVRLIRPQCAYCKQPVIGKFVNAMDLAWHPEHFTCALCYDPLEGKMFFEKEGRPYCQADYQRHFALRCQACATPIFGSAVMALEKPWHHSCFKCVKCSAQILSDTFKLMCGEPACNACLPLKQY